MTLVRATVLFVVLTAVMTWPQATHMSTHAAAHHDVFFNMWRVGWVAHALANSPSHVIDGNIFQPERRTLMFSDAMPVESLLGVPLLWAGAPPVLVHNLLLLGGMLLSAIGIFVLARRLTGSSAAATTAGIVFAFAPYRFEHYMHMELQWAVWTPWVFYFLHRAIERGSLGDGIGTGIAVSLQMLSSVYYGIFLALLLAVAAPLFVLAAQRDRLRALRALAAGAVVTVAICGAYALPYMAAKREVSGRPEMEILRYSARPANYLVPSQTNALYGGRSSASGRSERRLFPGFIPFVLAVFGLLAAGRTREAVVYLFALAAAFEMSLGLYGYSYRFLYEHVSALEGLRAPARFGIFVVFFLGLLAAYGQRALETVLPGRWHRLAATVIALAVMAEYWVAPLPLTPFPNRPPAVYEWLANQPRGAVLELPAPRRDMLPGADPWYSYMSTFHWKPMLNGYSGFYPSSYLERIDKLTDMPDDRTVAHLAADGLRYVIVHVNNYRPEEARRLVDAMVTSPYFAQLGRYDDGHGGAFVFRLR